MKIKSSPSPAGTPDISRWPAPRAATGLTAITVLRPGKIARLPRALREQINQRLQNGEPGEPLLAWLNPLPEVQTVLKDQFAGLPISKQNLSDWRKGGFIEWEFKQEISCDSAETIADAWEFDPPAHACLSDYLATVITARYASLVRHWNGEVTDELCAKLKVLHHMIRDISLLRRWDHSRAKLLIALAKQGDLSEETIADSEPPQNQVQSTEIPVAASRPSAADSGQSNPVKVSQGTLAASSSSHPSHSPTEDCQLLTDDFTPPSSPVKPSQGTPPTPSTSSSNAASPATESNEAAIGWLPTGATIMATYS